MAGEGTCEAGRLRSRPGHGCRPPEIGLLASLGVARCSVHRRPRVAILATGDEICPVEGGRPGPGQIRDSNGPMIAAFVAESRGGGGLARHRPFDARDDLRAKLAEAGKPTYS